MPPGGETAVETESPSKHRSGKASFGEAKTECPRQGASNAPPQGPPARWRRTRNEAWNPATEPVSKALPCAVAVAVTHHELLHSRLNVEGDDTSVHQMGAQPASARLE